MVRSGEVRWAVVWCGQVGWGKVRYGTVGWGQRPPFRRAIIWLGEILGDRAWWATPIKGVNNKGE